MLSPYLLLNHYSNNFQALLNSRTRMTRSQSFSHKRLEELKNEPQPSLCAVWNMLFLIMNLLLEFLYALCWDDCLSSVKLLSLIKCKDFGVSQSAPQGVSYCMLGWRGNFVNAFWRNKESEIWDMHVHCLFDVVTNRMNDQNCITNSVNDVFVIIWCPSPSQALQPPSLLI